MGDSFFFFFFFFGLGALGSGKQPATHPPNLPSLKDLGVAGYTEEAWRCDAREVKPELDANEEAEDNRPNCETRVYLCIQLI